MRNTVTTNPVGLITTMTQEEGYGIRGGGAGEVSGTRVAEFLLGGVPHRPSQHAPRPVVVVAAR